MGQTTDKQRKEHDAMMALWGSYHRSDMYRYRMDSLKEILVGAADAAYPQGWSSATMLVRLYYLDQARISELVRSGGFAAVERAAKADHGPRGFEQVTVGKAGPLVLPAVRGVTSEVTEYSVFDIPPEIFGVMMEFLTDWYVELDRLGMTPWDIGVITVDRIADDHHHGYGMAGWDRQLRGIGSVDPGDWLIQADERGVLLPDVEVSARAGRLISGQ